MKTPILDFVEQYAKSGITRLHMPGHKGNGVLGIESRDITEISGADVLYRENGILKESQDNAAFVFQSKKTLYSTEGSTLAIRAMLTLALLYAKKTKQNPIIACARNAHKSFLTTMALLDLDPIWLSSGERTSLLSCHIKKEDLITFFDTCQEKPVAVYITSPDYLGNIADISSLAKVCHQNGALLLVDNAHGAYLGFLPESAHPIALGADLCCDSAHKTLPVLTGGAYLHIGKEAPEILVSLAEEAMALYSSTSPSYLILQSLDACNRYLTDGYRERLYAYCDALFQLKKTLRKKGFMSTGSEPLKIALMPKSLGYSGDEIANILRAQNIECEFSDPDHTVLMFTPENGLDALLRVEEILCNLEEKNPLLSFPPSIPKAKCSLSVREALFSLWEEVKVEDAEGRILSQPCVNCPPAVPIAICGEVLTKEHLNAFSYYKIATVQVVKK